MYILYSTYVVVCLLPFLHHMYIHTYVHTCTIPGNLTVLHLLSLQSQIRGPKNPSSCNMSRSLGNLDEVTYAADALRVRHLVCTAGAPEKIE